MDPEQDAFDLSRGPLGSAQRTAGPGDLPWPTDRERRVRRHSDRAHDHSAPARDVDTRVGPGVPVEPALGAADITISCYHHQALDRLAVGPAGIAWSADGTSRRSDARSGRVRWFLGVQWHPEDTAATDPAQHTVFTEFVAASSEDIRVAAAG